MYQNLNAIGAKSLDVAIVDKVDTVKIDNPQIWGGRFHFMYINYFVNFFLFFTYLLIGSFK